ncbi:MAG TPA: multicopper oxidase domain-containing protein [Candidatus Elarobacter sp.]|jgi:FtsP/CotA-like multicopper oxidase with cupredoxin domain|nr:multicopper oxidase domain-containing protein [Candidatus Elarobacter sp.]
MLRARAIVPILAAAFVAVLAIPAGVAQQQQPPDVFPGIPEVRAVHGIVRLTLDVVLDPVSGYPAFSWNARLGVVPTIRVRPGETIEMTVHDEMRPFSGRPDDVNVHFHGLTVSPNPPGDDALGTLARPGQTLRYVVKIPADHEPGLYWYHPHAHGETYYEVTNGMSGALVVEGIQRHLPALAAMRERVIVLRDVPSGPGFVDDDMPMTGMAGMTKHAVITHSHTGPPCRPETGLQPTLNRQPDAHIGIRPGERQFFRVVNASAARYYDLSVDDAVLELVALDGVPLDAYPGTAPSRTVSHVLVPPAGRAEFVVTAPNHATVLRSACVDTGKLGDANPAAVLAHLVDPSNAAATGVMPANAAVAPAPLTAGAPLPRNVLSRPLPAPAARRTIRFTEDEHGFAIDGKTFRMNDPPAVVARSGTVEEWTVVNTTDEAHDFHIHQVHFVAESVNGVPVAGRTWLDTIDVPPRGRVRLVIDFRDPVVRGTFVYHCHILDHEDRGMMAKIRVI